MVRSQFIDIAKGIAIILVVIGHFYPNNSPEWYCVLHDVIYSFHMPLFLFCSGYVYKFVNLNDYSKFILKKVRRLIVPYMVTSVIVILIKLLTERFMYVENPVSYQSFFRILYLPEAGYFLWFIWALWLMFIVFPFFSITQNRRNWLYCIVLVLSYLPIEWTELFCINQTIHMARYFVFGMFVADYRQLLFPLKKIPEIIPCLLFGLAYIFKENSLANVVLPYLGVWMMLSASLKLSYKKNKISRAILFVSLTSYIIYLFHTTFEGFVKGILYKFSLFSPENDLVFIVCALFVTLSGILFPIGLYKYIITRFRITRFLFGIK